MFTRAKLIRIVLPIALVTSLLTVGSPSATAAVPVNGYYGCNSGEYVGSGFGFGTYQISSGSVSAGFSCSGAVVIATGVTGIGNSAFQGSTLTSITMPNSLTSIGEYAFFNAAALTSVTIPNSVTSISNFAFRGTTALTSVTIPNSVTTIGDFAFSFATALTSVTIPNSVTTIGDFAFQWAAALTSLTIPNSVNSIGNFAFANTPALTQYTYCGTSLTQANLDAALLNGKVKLCPVVVPMLPSFAPSISLNNGTITCTIGEYSRSATSVAFSLFVDGNHVATNFSATGDHLPSWLAPWASASTIQRSATLQSASWDIDIAGDASRASCWTLAYSNNATGLISSDQISLR